MDRRIGVAITTYNRSEMTLRCFESILHDDRVSEVTIVDDASRPDVYGQLEASVGGMDKVRLFRNQNNLGCYKNKKRAIELSESPWVIIADSDNIFDTSYLDVIFDQYWDEKKIMAPQFGRPALDYTQWSPYMFSSKNVAHYVDQGNFAMLLNTFNFFVNRKQFLNIFDDSVEPWTSDSIYFNYCWMAAGNYIHVVPGLSYIHSIHNESHYTLNNHRDPGFYQYVLQKLRELK